MFLFVFKECLKNPFGLKFDIDAQFCLYFLEIESLGKLLIKVMLIIVLFDENLTNRMAIILSHFEIEVLTTYNVMAEY